MFNTFRSNRKETQLNGETPTIYRHKNVLINLIIKKVIAKLIYNN